MVAGIERLEDVPERAYLTLPYLTFTLVFSLEA